jgi:hypothetical protein
LRTGEIMPKTINIKPKPARKTKARTKKTVAVEKVALTSDERLKMIQYAAYHIAEKDGFQPGKEEEYWLQAEQQLRDILPQDV